LLHSWAQDFRAGKPDDLLKQLEAGEGAMGRATFGRVGFAAVLILVIAKGGDPGLTCVSVLLVLPLTAFFTSRVIRKVRTKRRLVRDGEVLAGDIVHCTGRTANTGGDDGSDYYQVTVAYRFRSPAGRELRGKDSAWREDLERAPLPAPGTPVLVVYLEDKTYQLL
jgi:hypothetical protein